MSTLPLLTAAVCFGLAAACSVLLRETPWCTGTLTVVCAVATLAVAART